MLNPKMSKSDIEKSIRDKGFFVQIDWLTRFLKEPLTMDMKKFVCLKLAEIYEKTNMPKESAKMHGSAGMISVTFNEKMRHFVKEAELLIGAGAFDDADKAMKNAMNQANSIEKNDIYYEIKSFAKQGY